MSDFYYGDTLAHYGVKGMKWGVRRYQKKDGTLTRAGRKRYAKEEHEKEKEEVRTRLRKEADEAYNKSEYAKLYKSWRKKNPNNDEDDFGDYLADEHPDWDESSDTNFKVSANLHSRANKLNKNYVRGQTVANAAISGMLVAPVTSFIAARATKRIGVEGKKRAAIILGTGLGTVAVSALYANVESRREVKKAEAYLGIKSAKERFKESK